MFSRPLVLCILYNVAVALKHKQAAPFDWIQKCPSSECEGFSWPPAAHNTTALVSANHNTTFTAKFREELLAGCGEICDTSARPGKLGLLRKKVDCPALFANTHADAPSTVWPPPQAIPALFQQDFLMGNDGAVASATWYFTNKLSGTDGAFGDALNAGWTESGVDKMIANAVAGHPDTGYTKQESIDIQTLIRKHKASFEGKRLLVLGSLTPWLESILLEVGAAHVTTIEYGVLPKTPHPKLSTMTPAEAAAAFIAGTLPKFQGGATYSSVEHSGLGRYGDTINPWGDLQAIAKIWCMMEPGSMFMNGVPDGHDEVTWNAHRIYGERRWPHLMANWEHVDNTAIMGPYKQTAALYRKVE